MTEKRFKFVCDDENCFFKDDNKVLDCYEVVYKLNKLHEEKEQLTKENKELKKKLNYLSKKKKHYLCFDCKFSDNFEIECWCDKADQWVDCKHDCEDFRRIKND